MSKKTIIDMMEEYKAAYIAGIDALKAAKGSGEYTPEYIAEQKDKIAKEYGPKLDELRGRIIEEVEAAGEEIKAKRAAAAVDTAPILQEALTMLNSGALDRDIVKMYAERLKGSPASLAAFHNAISKSKDESTRLLSVSIAYDDTDPGEICGNIANRAMYLPKIGKESAEHLAGFDTENMYYLGHGFDGLINYIEENMPEE